MNKILSKLPAGICLFLLFLTGFHLSAQSTEGTACTTPSVYDVDAPFPRSVNIPQFENCPIAGENCAPLQIISSTTAGTDCFLDLGALAANGNTVVRDASGQLISGRNFEQVVPCYLLFV